MENQSNIISGFKEMVAREEKRLKEKNTYDRLTAANDLYNKLLEKGLIKKKRVYLTGNRRLAFITCKAKWILN